MENGKMGTEGKGNGKELTCVRHWVFVWAESYSKKWLQWRGLSFFNVLLLFYLMAVLSSYSPKDGELSGLRLTTLLSAWVDWVSIALRRCFEILLDSDTTGEGQSAVFLFWFDNIEVPFLFFFDRIFNIEWERSDSLTPMQTQDQASCLPATTNVSGYFLKFSQFRSAIFLESAELKWK